MTDLLPAIEAHFGDALSSPRSDEPIGGVLYDALALYVTPSAAGFTAELSDGLAPSTSVSAPTVEEALAAVEQAARLRLPAAYLDAWRAAKTDTPAPDPYVQRVQLSAPDMVLHTLRFWGTRLTDVEPDSDDLGISGLLYGVFDFGCNLDEDGLFNAAVLVDERYPVQDYLGHGISPEADAVSITTSLEAIERWCELRLPGAATASPGSVEA
jgi:hypothetical protein